MKIAYLISSCSSGGAELLVKRLCEAIKIADSTVQIQIWAMCRAADSYENCQQSVLDFESRYISDMKKSGVTVRFLDKKKNSDRLTACRRIRAFYKDFLPDVVHAHSEICATYSMLALIGIKHVSIHTIHSSKIFHPQLIRTLLSKHMDAFVAISEEVTASMNRVSIPQSKTILITNGVELDRYHYPARLFKQQQVNIIAVGRLANEKDYPYLIHSFKQACEQLSQTNCVLPHLNIVGTGTLADSIQMLIHEQKIDQYVTLLGIRQDIPALLSQSDLYVMSSSFEGLSLALIEAAASGLPIIATNVGSNNKIVQTGVNGILVEHGDVEAFSRALISMITNERLRKQYSAASVKIASEYNIAKTAEQYIYLYKKLVDTKRT